MDILDLEIQKKELKKEKLRDLLNRLKVERNNGLKVSESYRNDLDFKIYVIEEILRSY